MEYINGFEKEIIFDQEVKNVELQIKHKLNNFHQYILVKLLK